MTFYMHIKYLLESGDLFRIRHKESDIVEAVKENNLKALKLLVKMSTNLRMDKPYDKSGISVGNKCLLAAIRLQNSEMVRVLYTSGLISNIREKTMFGDEPIHFAATHGSVAILRYLLEIGADATVTNELGWDPIFIAAAKGNFEAFKFLVDSNHVNLRETFMRRDYSGESILHASCVSGNVELVKYLLDHLPDEDILQEKSLFTDFMPLDYAIFNNQTQVVSVIRDRFPKLLIENDLSQFYELETAIMEGDHEKLHMMAANVNLGKILGYHLFDAILQRDIESVRFLVKALGNFDPTTISDNFGRNLLEISRKMGFTLPFHGMSETCKMTMMMQRRRKFRNLAKLL